RRGGVGYGGSLGSAGSAGAPHPGQAGGLAGGLGRGFGALGQAAHDGRGVPEIDQTFYGNGSAGNPFTTLGKQVNKIMTSRCSDSLGQPHDPAVADNLRGPPGIDAGGGRAGVRGGRGRHPGRR
ncbi:unnamed protein product, partial [Laminaria digitata]